MLSKILYIDKVLMAYELIVILIRTLNTYYIIWYKWILID